MANRGYGYQYETSPRKVQPEYKVAPKKKKQVTKKTSKKVIKNKSKKKFKLSFEIKFFANSMLIFAVVFAVIACQALVGQRYKEKENLKKHYNELLASIKSSNDVSDATMKLATEYGMQTKSAILINLETTDYIESSKIEVQSEETGFFEKIINWIKGVF